MFEALDERNETIAEAKQSPHQHVRDSVGRQRTLARSTYRRIRATLSTAMTAAVCEELVGRRTRLEVTVRDLAARESDCCSLFTFTTSSSAPGQVSLDVELRRAHVDVLSALA